MNLTDRKIVDLVTSKGNPKSIYNNFSLTSLAFKQETGWYGVGGGRKFVIDLPDRADYTVNPWRYGSVLAGWVPHGWVSGWQTAYAFWMNGAGGVISSLAPDLPGNYPRPHLRVMREQMRELLTSPPGNWRQCLTFGGTGVCHLA